MSDLLFQHTPNARMLVDFGLVILIWIVQLIINPSFRYTSADAVQAWHGQYTFLISIIVVPLMLSQVGLIGFQLLHSPNWAMYVTAGLIALIWLSTFLQVVPVHNALTAGEDIATHVEQLIKLNWPRTLMWTLVFALNFVKT